MAFRIFQLMYSWIPWTLEQAKQEIPIRLDFSIFLEGIHCILLLQSPLMIDSKMLKHKDDTKVMYALLKPPWTHSVIGGEPNLLGKTKCISVQVATKLADGRSESDLEVLDLGLHDEDEEVRSEAVISVPMIVLWSGRGILSHLIRRLEFLEGEKHEKVKNVVPFSYGYLSCLSGSCNAGDDLDKSE